MTEKSAIEKLVEWLEASKKRCVTLLIPINGAIDEARRLAAEEKAKPVEATAEASLVEIISDWEKAHPCNVNISQSLANHITSRYRPASPAVEELVRELKSWAKQLEVEGNSNPMKEKQIEARNDMRAQVTAILAKYDKGDK